jgi:hypothetical protein
MLLKSWKNALNTLLDVPYNCYLCIIVNGDVFHASEISEDIDIYPKTLNTAFS